MLDRPYRLGVLYSKGGAIKREKSHKPRGFTLIELLVVIAIIAVLMGILMPVLGKARKHAWTVACQSNMRQIGTAANLFAEDHEQKVPRGGDQAEESSKKESSRWYRAFMRYLAQRPKDGDYSNVKIYRCPAYPDKRQTICYLVNAWKDGNTEYTGLSSLTKVGRPAEKIYLGEHEHNQYRPIITRQDSQNYGEVDVWKVEHLGHSKSDRARRVAKKRHKQGFNILFFDWHAGYLQVDQEDIQSKIHEIRMWELNNENKGGL